MQCITLVPYTVITCHLFINTYLLITSHYALFNAHIITYYLIMHYLIMYYISFDCVLYILFNYVLYILFNYILYILLYRYYKNKKTIRRINKTK